MHTCYAIKIRLTFNFYNFLTNVHEQPHFYLLLHIYFRRTQNVTNLSENTPAESIWRHAKNVTTGWLGDFPAESSVTKYTSTVLMTSRSLWRKWTPVNSTHQLLRIPRATGRKSRAENPKRHLTAVWNSMTFHPEVKLITVVTCSLIWRGTQQEPVR